MSVEAIDPGSRLSTFEERIARERLHLAATQIVRLPLPSLTISVFLAWLLVHLELTAFAIVWLLLFAAVEGTRWVYARQQLAQAAPSPGPPLRRLRGMMIALGVTRAVLVPAFFIHGLANETFLFTMVITGLAAGAVATTAGDVKTYAGWALPCGGALVVAWLTQGGWTGVTIAALLTMLFLVLTGFVRDQDRAMRKMVALAVENEVLIDSLKVERDRVAAASQAKTRFFAAASHDLRQPLHALSIHATTLELMASRQADTAIKDLSQSIQRALAHSNGLLDGLLDLSKLDAGAVRPSIESIPLAPVLRSLHEQHLPVAALHGLLLELDIADSLEAAAVSSDAELLTRVLANLIGNALKFTQAGSVRITARESNSGKAVLIGIEDTGPGIPAEQQQRVFEEFYQIANPSRDRNQGLGLGLSIVKRTVELLGVGLELRSTVGKGTIVEITLPRAEQNVCLQEAAEPPAAANLPAGLRVLIIDDEIEVLESVAQLLAQLGCEVHGAAGTTDAISLLAQSGVVPDVLLVDHRLRGESGVQAVDRICAHLGHEVPAVIVTGDTGPETLRQALASGHRVVHKPVDGRRLAAVLAEVAEGVAVCSESPGTEAELRASR